MKLITQHTLISILVRDQEEAVHFYTQVLGLEKRKDISFGPGMRLVTVGMRGQEKPELALAKPDVLRHNPEQVAEVMKHIGQGVPVIFNTDDCCLTYEILLARGVSFITVPTHQRYGVEAVFMDPSGNPFLLLEASPEIRSLFERRDVGTAA